MLFCSNIIISDNCVVGCFRFKIPHNKVIFAILHDNNTVDFLNKKNLLKNKDYKLNM